MFKKTLLASAIVMSSHVAVAQDADIIEKIKTEANSIVSEFVQVESQVITDAQIGDFNAFEDATTSNNSNYTRVANFESQSLRLKFANIYIGIYERALTSSYKLIDRIEGFKPSLRDRIKGMSFYKKLLDRVSFYEAEIVKYKSLLNTKQEVSRDVQVVEKTNVVVSDPVLIKTEFSTETLVEDNMQNTYELAIKTFETTTTTTVVQVTTTTINYSDNTQKVDVSETVLSESQEVAESKTTEQTRLLTSVPVETPNEIVDTIRTGEYYGNYALDMIGADVAYEQGYTGAGVTVGVVDTGLTDLNNKFSNVVQTYNIIDGSSNVLDDNGHGTHVAGIIAANKTNDTMHGVAYNADLVVIKALDANGSASHQNLAKAIAWSADAGSKVTNVSVTGNLAYNLTGKSDAAFDFFYGNIKPIMGKDSVVVVAAGNSRLDCKVDQSTYSNWLGDDYTYCGFPAALPQVTQFKDLEDQWIAVGAVDSTGELARYSNKAGVTKDWYIVAPGSDILSTSADGGYETMSGTSMAAPVVTGAFALLAEKFPHLTGTQIRSIIFQTADDLGEVGVDDVYGNGLLNVGRAMAPIGDLTLPQGATVSGTSTKVESSAVIAPAGMASALASSMNSVGVLDSFDRVYHIDASSTVYSTPSAFSFDNYVTAESNDIIFGVTQIQNDLHSDAVIGYKITDNISLMYGQEKGAFGSVDTDLAGFGVDSTDYIRMGYSAGGLNLNLDYGHASGGEGVGVIKNTSDLHGLGFNINYTSQFKKSSHTIALSSPVKVESGYAEVETLTSRNVDGTLNYSSQKVDLSNSDREYVLSNSYTQRFGSSSTIRFNHSAAFGDINNNSVSVSLNYNF